MNAKGTRFLAVLAVMAMAFAAFAVVDYADATAKVDGKYIEFNQGDITVVTEDATIAGGNAYYVGTGGVTLTVSSQTTAGIVVFLVDGKEITITGSASALVSVYSVSAMSTTSTTSSTEKLSLFVKNGLKAACVSEGNFVVPADYTAVTAIADLDLPVASGVTITVNTGKATIISTNGFAVPAGYTLNADVVMTKNKAMTLNKNSAFTGAFYVPVENSDSAAKVADITNLVSSKNGSTLTAGSVTISGEFGAAEIAAKIAQAADQEVILTNLTITAGNLVLDTEVTLSGQITVEGGATLTINEDVNIAEEDEATITNNGTIDKGTGVDLVTNENLTIGGSGTIENVQDSSNMETQKVSGRATQTTTYPSNQVIVVDVIDGNWTIVTGAKITILGELEVPAGTTVVIEEGAELIIDNAAIATISGTMTINEKEDTNTNGKFVVKSGTVEVYGGIESAGDIELTNTMQPYGNIVIEEDGYVIIGDSGALKDTNANKSSVEVKADALLTVYGALAIQTIYNSGIVIIESEVPALGDSVIYQAADGAIVDVVQYTVATAQAQGAGVKTLTISDLGLVFAKNTKVLNTMENRIVISPAVDNTGANPPAAQKISVFGIVVGEDVTSKSTTAADDPAQAIYNKKQYTNTMLIAGEMNVLGSNDNGDDINPTLTVTLTALKGAEVLDLTEVELGLGVTFENAQNSLLTVYGSFDASTTINGSGQCMLNNNGTVTVLGDGIVTKHTGQLGGTVNAVEFITKLSTTSYYNYVSMDTALDLVNEDNTITKLKARGATSVTKSNLLPANVTLDVPAGSTVTVGSATNTDIMLTIDEEASVKGAGTIDVKASMYAENQSVVKPTVKSDVKTTQLDAKGKEVPKGWALWTNVYTALASAQPGDTVKITSTDDFVYLNSSVEIKEGVTLYVPGPKGKLWLGDGVTLTVNGTLESNEDIYANTKFDLTAKYLANEYSSAIIANGVLDLAKITNYAAGTAVNQGDGIELSAGAPIAGAYYKVDERYIISSFDIAMLAVDEITTPITINGAVATDLAIFEAAEDCKEMIIGDSLATIPTSLTVGALALDGTKITSTSATGELNAKIIVGDTAVTVKGLSAGNETGYTISDSSDKLVLAGAMRINDTGDAITINEGTTYTGTNLVVTGSKVVKVASGATLEANTTFASINKLTVDGVLYVPNTKALTVTTLVNNGSVIIDPTTATSTAGTLNVKDFYVGITSSDYDVLPNPPVAAAPYVSGAFTMTENGKVVAKADSVFDDLADEVLAGMNSVVYVVEGKEWFTVYALAASQAMINVDTAPLTDSELMSWNTKADATGTSVALNEQYRIGTATYKTLYAIVDYSIYGVTIITDNGIKSVAIDGVQLEAAGAYGKNIYQTRADLEAGVHTVSFTYESGYTGTVNLYTYPDGTILKDYKFTLSGDRHNISLQLSGTEQAIEPTPEPEPLPEEKEWTITTILLLVLVILIAVMAVIVALRLNRN